MSDVLSDGSVIPKYFSPHNPVINAQNDMTLRMGRITNIYYPTDQGNLSGLFVEYDVLVDYTDPYGNYSKVLYPRCKVVSRFGGPADFEFYTYRQTTIKPEQLNNQDAGSVVLVLCVNSDRRQGYILSGVPHNFLPQNPNFKNLALAPGTNYVWEFNGAIINVNDNGELLLKFTGKTNINSNDGSISSPIDPNNALTEILFNDQGELILSTNDQNSILISNQNSGFVDISADNVVNVNTNSGNINLTPNNPLSGVQIGEATNYMMLGTTYRLAQTSLDETIVALATALEVAATTWATGVNTMINALTPPNGTSKSTVQPSDLLNYMNTANIGVQGVLTAAIGLIAAFQAFEAGSLGYISIRNKND
jgi:hypothetical protein